MKITILAPGSRGDVQPYVALGQGLKALGHACTLVTTLDHEALVGRYGLGVATIPVNVAEELGRVEAQRAVEGGGVISSFRQFAAIARRAARATAEIGLEACRSADTIVTNFSTVLLADGISRKLGVPMVQAFNVPVTASSAFPGALFPGLDFGSISRRLGHSITRTALWTTSRSAANAVAIEVLGARSASLFPGRCTGLVPGPVVYGFSEAFLARPADWSDEAHVTGFWFVEEPRGYAPSEELVRFLESGPPPVCVGFGSMSTERPEEVSAMVLDAARASNSRLVLQSGWAGLNVGQLADNVLVVSDIPHSWLYPRCAAIVHHGGAGTTAAALRAGVPAVVVPFHGDQPFWASRVARLGLGPAPIPRRKLTAERLASAIERARIDEGLRERAALVGRTIREERGTARAAELIASLSRG
ncbi:MAG: glycosyltransferase [Polyangiaceae bacterium]